MYFGLKGCKRERDDDLSDCLHFSPKPYTYKKKNITPSVHQAAHTVDTKKERQRKSSGAAFIHIINHRPK